MNQALDLAVIGNNRIAALMDTKGRLVWWCFPRLDSDPVFCRLIAGDEEKGFSDVVLSGFVKSESSYVVNTATVVTLLTAEDGAQVRITDFAPRFRNFDRMLRPPQLMRIIEAETSFALTHRLHLILGPDEPFSGEPAATVRDFERRTRAYWQEWVRGISIPYEWQDATIRAAITLKLSNFVETGGIVAALTTSIPEAPHSG